MNIITDILDHQLTFRYADYLWFKSQVTWRRTRILAFASISLLVAVVTLQILYPTNWSLPHTQIAGHNYGLKSQAFIQNNLQTIESQPVTVKTQTTMTKPALKDLGITLQVKAMASRATSYSFAQRFIPFSWFTRKYSDPVLSYAVNQKVADSYVQTLVKTNTQPVNAVVTLNGTNVTVSPAKTGFAYNPEDSSAQFASIILTKNFSITFAPHMLYPAISTAAAEATAKTVNDQLANMTVTAADETNVASAKTVASWMTITPNTANHTIDVSYDRAKIKTFLQSFSGKLYIANTPNQVSLVDGEQVSTSSGKSGQALDIEASTDAIIASLKQGSHTAKASVTAITPSTQFVRSYTRTNKGLNALITYWMQSHNGTYGAMIQATDGSFAASKNESRTFTTASVYKMYVAYGIYHKIEAGDITENTITSTGKTVSACLEVMIVVSDNTCGVALGSLVGWPTVNSWLKPLGLTGTDISQSGDLKTTPKDAVTFLNQLQAGTLMNAAHTSALLGLMKSQIYRAGIPAGVPGVTVADKVGWLDGINNDAAIVYDPKGTYILVIMTENSGWAEIKDLAAQINAVLAQ